MDALTEKPEKKSAKGPRTLDEGLSRFDERLAAGDFSPYKDRLERWQRPSEFKKLREARGSRYAGCTLGNYETSCDEQRSIVRTIQEFCWAMPDRIGRGGGLVLLGSVGTGKDHLLFAAMRSAIFDHGFTVGWSDGLRLYQRIKSAIATGRTEDFLQQMFNPQILALSDPIPPRDELTAYELSILRDIVEHRYSHGLSTWVTTNCDNRADAVRLFSGAVLDRLLHDATEVFCEWTSFRQPRA